MELIRMYQVTGLAAIGGGLGVLASYLLSEGRKEKYPTATWWVYNGNNILIVLAFFGFYLRLVNGAEAWGLAALVLAGLGVVVLTYPGELAGIESESLGSMLLALGVLCITAGGFIASAFPVWVLGLWAVSFVAGLPGLVVSRWRLASYLLGGIPFSLGFVAAGLSLLSGP